MEFILADQNTIFALALVTMLAIAVLEGVLMLLGFGVFQVIDTFIPDVEIDHDMEVSTTSPVSGFLGWLHIGEVPILIILVVFLTTFGIFGLLAQRVILNATGGMWSGGMLAVPVLALSLPAVSFLGGVLAKHFPKTLSEAVSEEDFVGSTAKVVLGSGELGKPVQAKITDNYGQDHYVMVEPETQGVQLESGDSVTITGRSGAVYKATTS